MTIEVITPMFDEEYLLPIFLEHYKFADEITFFYDTDTTDNSLEVIKKHKKTDVTIVEFNGEGLNDLVMINLLHEKLNSTAMDYSICVDSDELLFHPNKNFNRLGADIKEYISEEQRDFYISCFYQMYPHQTEEKDISWNIPIWEQRKYGTFHNMYMKPCIIKRDSELEYSDGKHHIFKKGTIVPENKCFENECIDFDGCHLNNINLELSLERRLEKRKGRMSEMNISRGAGEEYLFLTENDIRLEFSKEYQKLW